MGEDKTAGETRELREALGSLKKDVGDVARTLKDATVERLSSMKQKVVSSTSEWTKEHPAASIGIVAGVAASVGFIVGLLVGRSRD